MSGVQFMSNESEQTVFAVQAAVMALLEAVEQAARNEHPERVQELCSEAQKTALMLMAGIILSDGQYSSSEALFVNLLVNSSDKPGGDIGFLNEYAENWKRAAYEVPGFFKLGVDKDLENGTRHAPAMLRELQLIGNNTAITDGTLGSVQNDIVRDYVLRLEEFAMIEGAKRESTRRKVSGGWTAT